MKHLLLTQATITAKKTALAVAFFTCVALMPSTASAEVTDQSDNGFSIIYIGDVAASPEDIWRTILLPATWWSADHSWSGNAENFYIEPKVNGCFCELLMDEQDDGTTIQAGEVEHMRIIHINKDRVLRMAGALGPLQSEAVNGTLTIAIQPNDNGTSKLSFSYIVGGYMRYPVASIAPNIDQVIGEQYTNLAKKLGPIITLPSAARRGSLNTDGISAEDDKTSPIKDEPLSEGDEPIKNPINDVRRER